VDLYQRFLSFPKIHAPLASTIRNSQGIMVSSKKQRYVQRGFWYEINCLYEQLQRVQKVGQFPPFCHSSTSVFFFHHFLRQSHKPVYSLLLVSLIAVIMVPLIDTSLTNETEAHAQRLVDGLRSYANDAQIPPAVANASQMCVAGRDAATSVVNCDLPATTAAIRTGMAEGQATLKSAADGTTTAANRIANATMLASVGSLLFGLVNAVTLYRQSSAMMTRAQVGVADHNLAYQAGLQGSTGQDRAFWIVKDAISTVEAVLGQMDNPGHLKPIILLIGDYHDTHASTWETINDLMPVNDKHRALFPEKQLDCLVTTLPAAIKVAVKHLASHARMSEKPNDTKSPHFFFLLRGHGDIQFAQVKQRHKAITIPFELSKCVSIIGRGGCGDTNAHALHMDSKIEEEPREFVSILEAEHMLWHLDAWRSGVSLYKRGRETIGFGTEVVGGAGGMASVAGAWGAHALHAGVVLTGTALLAPGAVVYGAGEIASRLRSEDYTITEARRLLDVRPA
jgi:hypothetical protein